MIAKHRLAEVAALLADPSRAAMLSALQNGRAETAGTLARAAGVSAATASAHLAKLRASGLIRLQSSGRHRYFRLAGHEVNDALEALARLIPPMPRVVSTLTGEQRALATARLCYDHLAGALGVAVTDALVRKQALISRGDDFTLAIGPRARAVFARLDIDLDDERLASGTRPLVRSCTDWTERREHLAGALGAAMALVCLEHRWVQRVRGTRGLRVTEAGRRAFADRLGLKLDARECAGK